MSPPSTRWVTKWTNCGPRWVLWVSIIVLVSDRDRGVGVNRGREKDHPTPVYVTIIGHSGTAHENVPLQIKVGNQDRPSVNCGIRRLLGNPLHLCHGQEDENFILSGHQCRHMCVSAQQNRQIREQKRLRIVHGQRNTHRDLRQHHSVPQPIATSSLQVALCNCRCTNTQSYFKE